MVNRKYMANQLLYYSQVLTKHVLEYGIRVDASNLIVKYMWSIVAKESWKFTRKLLF